MPRVTNAPVSRRRRKKVLKKARGFFGNKSRLYRYAKEAVDRAERFAYRDRRKRKTAMRQLWIVRINAACRAEQINYSCFMAGLKALGIEMNRKVLSELAVHDALAFKRLARKVKSRFDHAVSSGIDL